MTCHRTCFLRDVSQEASSMAGHMKLGKLIVLYDSNDISLDGPTSKAFTENVGARYEAYGNAFEVGPSNEISFESYKTINLPNFI